MNDKVKMIKIADIAPAPYNPRIISDKQIEELQKSIEKVGFVVPILVNKANNIIIAGHQRSKSAKALGYEEVPAIYVDDIVKGDEIKFNQMHNGVEEKTLGSIILTKEYEKEQFITADYKDFKVDKSAKFAMPVVKEICKIIVKYGNVMSAVACKGQVVFACEYVYACKMVGKPVNLYICDDDKFDDIKHFFLQNYGEYSYDGIEKKTFVQGLAQMNRSVEDLEDKKSNKSALYEKMVFPYLQKHEVGDILDFGCGKGAYIKSLKKKYNAIGLEFFNHNNSGIIVSKGMQMIDALIEKVKGKPQFDVVVCDSVLNSVDSLMAEKSVVVCCNLFCKEKLFISGRPQSRLISMRNSERSTDKGNYIYYPDKDGFTATYRKGQWFFQKFHTDEQIYELLEGCGFRVDRITKTTTSWQAECTKVKELPVEEYQKAIDFEFNLPLPNGKTYNRHEDMKRALGL